MHNIPMSGWEMAVYAVIAVALLVLGTFRLDEALVRSKREEDGPRSAGRQFQQPGSRLMDPHGRGSARASARRSVSDRK